MHDSDVVKALQDAFERAVRFRLDVEMTSGGPLVKHTEDTKICPLALAGMVAAASAYCYRLLMNEGSPPFEEWMKMVNLLTKAASDGVWDKPSDPYETNLN